MHYRSSFAFAIVLTLTLSSMCIGHAQTFDDTTKYPNLKGQWRPFAVPHGFPYASIQYDPRKPGGRGQQAPLKPEYQAIHEANMADQALGTQRGDPTYKCLSPGMPRVMTGGLEIVVTPETTYIMALTGSGDFTRWIYTDARDFPATMSDNPQSMGYSIGRWVDEDGDGLNDVLIIETRGIKGPRAYDATGIPLHEDNQSIIKERIYLDKTDPNVLHDEITTIDNALTRPWTITKDYRRAPTGQPLWWSETICSENNVHVTIGDENYFLSADGLLMPTRRDQAPPDLRYFKQTGK
jgi:hypothetical protein